MTIEIYTDGACSGNPGIGGWGMGGPYGPHSMQAFSKRCASIYFSFSNMSDSPIIIGRYL